MTRRTYSGYQYEDLNNLYTYPESNILKNKHDIRDVKTLLEIEHKSVASRILKLTVFPIKVYSMNNVKEIHRYLFQDIYEWSGNLRKVNISKEGKAFMSLQSFDQGSEYMNYLIDNYHETANTKDKVVSQLAAILDNLNHMHPFREGNGRTQREVIRVLALQKGYYGEIDILLDDEIFHLYMDGTVYEDVAKLEELFARILEEIDE